MILDEASKLNKNILNQDMALLGRRTVENDNRKTIELARFAFKSNLDKKIFTNDERREAEANKEPVIATAITNLNQFIYETTVLEAEREYNLRSFAIMMKS